MTAYHGRDIQALLQRESVFRTAPAAAAFKMKVDEFEMGDEVAHQDNNTLENTPLAGKRDDGDVGFAGTIKAPLDLNDIGQYLALLWGAPVTTGVGPYTHTFTLDLAERPTALLELGYITATKYRRWLGCPVNSLAWNVIEGDQNLDVSLMGAVEVTPRPTSAFDAAPTAYARNRACSKGGEIYDVQGASTLGGIASGSVNITNNLEGLPLADGLEGYGAYLLGQPEITGELTALLYDGSLMDYLEAHTSVPLELVSKNSAGDASLKLILPKVEFDKPSHTVNTSKGLIMTANWRAHGDATATTIELINSIASY